MITNKKKHLYITDGVFVRHKMLRIAEGTLATFSFSDQQIGFGKMHLLERQDICLPCRILKRKKQFLFQTFTSFSCSASPIDIS